LIQPISTYITFVKHEDFSYGSYPVVNLFVFRAKDKTELKNRLPEEEAYKDEVLNDIFIESDIIIVGWGSNFDGCTREVTVDIANRISEVEDMLTRYFDKIYIFGDGKERIEL